MNKQEFILTEEMQDAYQSIRNGQSTLIFGSAGSGKSTFITYLVNNGLNIIKLAPTGVASASIGGMTIHKFHSLPPKLVPIEYTKSLNPERIKMLEKADAILIDEISMVRADMMDTIDHTLRKSIGNRDVPFGGIPIIMMGDLGQLPPVTSSPAEKEYITFNYKSPFFFDSNAFGELEDNNMVNMISFTKIFRQKDEKFIDLLNKIRRNTISMKEIDELNDTCFSRKSGKEIILCNRNAEVDMVNSNSLYENDNPEELYEGIIEGDFDVRNCIADYKITLKKGCRVMILINGDDYNNGSLGNYIGRFYREKDENNVTYEVEMDDNTPNSEVDFYLKIQLDKEVDGVKPIVELKKNTFVDVEQNYDRKNNKLSEKEKGKMHQFPIRLAYAITVHKSQGLTFDSMSFDVGRNGAFSHGQVYVALSRCRSLGGLNLTRRIQKRDIIIDPHVKEFLNNNNL